MAYIDKNTFLATIAYVIGTTAWASQWALNTQYYTNSIDMGVTANRKIVNGGCVVFRVGTVPVQAGNSTRLELLCSASATGGTDTILWSTGELANTVVNAWTVNSIVFVVKIPAVIPLQYFMAGYYLTTTAWTAGTMDIFCVPQWPVPYSGGM